MPFVRQALEQEVQKQQAKVEQQKAQQKAQVVKTIIAELRPTIIRIIQATVAQSDLSNYKALFQTIITQLWPVVPSSVQNVLTTSSYRFDTQVLKDQIMHKDFTRAHLWIGTVCVAALNVHLFWRKSPYLLAKPWKRRCRSKKQSLSNKRLNRKSKSSQLSLQSCDLPLFASFRLLWRNQICPITKLSKPSLLNFVLLS